MRDDLLIGSRILLLKQSLESVQAVLKAIEESRTPIKLQLDIPHDETLLKLVAGVRELASQVTLSARRDAMPLDVYKNINALARQIGDETDAIVDRLESLESERITPLERRRITIEEIRAGMEAGDLGDQADAQLKEITALSDRVDAAIAAAGGQPAADALFTAWQHLATITNQSDKIFREYVELLAGLAIRESGLDSGLCRIADKLMKDWQASYWPWASWTIPTRQVEAEATLARVLRIGFPEWSLWSLPLAAHEFGKIALEGNRLAGVAQTHGGVEHARTLLSDIFATYVAGPAYACALFYLRLKPPAAIAVLSDGQETAPPEDGGQPYAAADEGPTSSLELDPLDLHRAFVTLRTLEELDQDEGHLAFVLGKLTTYWDQALEQARVDPAIPQEGALRGMVTDMVRKVGTTYVFPIRRWPDIETWAGSLVNEQGNAIPVNADDNDEVRIALNVAWLARLKPGDSSLDVLAREGRDLAERVIDVAELGPSPTTLQMSDSKAAVEGGVFQADAQSKSPAGAGAGR